MWDVVRAVVERGLDGVPDAEQRADAIMAALRAELPHLERLELYTTLLGSVAHERRRGAITAKDEAGVVAALMLARRLDLGDEYFEDLARDAAECNRKPPSPDNVSMPTYLRYLTALGLVPEGLTAEKSGGGPKNDTAARRARAAQRRKLAPAA